MSTPRPNFFVWLMDWSGRILLILMIAAVPIIAIGLVRLHLQYGDVAHWVEVPAEVSLRKVSYFDESNGSKTGRHVTQKMWTFADCTYAVNGVTYQGHTVSAHGPDPHAELPEHPTAVFYNPAHPADAVLVREPPEQGAIIICFVLCLAGTLALAYPLIKNMRKQRQRQAFLKRKPAHPAG